jgi:hypothetical protein
VEAYKKIIEKDTQENLIINLPWKQEIRVRVPPGCKVFKNSHIAALFLLLI